jgi:hypothetical protein
MLRLLSCTHQCKLFACQGCVEQGTYGIRIVGQGSAVDSPTSSRLETDLCRQALHLFFLLEKRQQRCDLLVCGPLVYIQDFLPLPMRIGLRQAEQDQVGEVDVSVRAGFQKATADPPERGIGVA